MKSSYIIRESNEIKNYIETNKRLPKTNTINNVIYSIYTTSYLQAVLIDNKMVVKDYTTVPMTLYNTTQHKDTINEQVLKDDYLAMIKNFIKYCKTNKRVPSYITTTKSKTKVSYELFEYCLCKIIVFYQKNNYLPNYCQFNKADLMNTKTSTVTANKTVTSSTCTNPYKSIPVNSQSGCDAMGQNTSYYCGVCALQKVLYKFGIKVPQKKLAEVAGTTTSGTSHQGIKTAVAWVGKKYNVKLSVKEYYFSSLGFEKIAKMICKPNTDAIWHINYRGKYGHYEKVKSIDVKNSKLEIMNSLGNRCNNPCYCGYVENRDFNTQKQYINGISQPTLIVITKG